MGRRNQSTVLQEWMHSQKLAAAQMYELGMTATTPSTKSRLAGPGGADGNFHIANQGVFLKSVAFARMMENNDPAVFSAANRLVNNVNVGQMTPEPDTGSDAMNDHLQGEWKEYTTNPHLCDATGRWNYETQADTAFRRIMIDGDIFVVPDDIGAGLHLEAHRCQGPTRGRKYRGVCGVQTKDNKPHRYWLTKYSTGYGHAVQLKDLDPRDAYNSEGWPNVFHCYNPKMFTLYRGIGALGACGTVNSQRDDLQFATVLKAQTANCVTFIESVDEAEIYKLLLEKGQAESLNADVGEVYFDKDSAGYEVGTADIHPGRVLRPKDGKKLTMETPNIPGHGQLELNLLLLQYLAMCWDLPLVSLLLDARMGSFTTFRGVMDIARTAYEKHQGWFAACYHRPRYRNWLRIKAATDPEIKRFREQEVKSRPGLKLIKSRVLRHDWNAAAWKYYHPVDDATGDLIQLANGMQSYDQYAHRRHGMTGAALRDAIVKFNTETYRQILAAKVDLLSGFKEKIPGLQINEHLLFPWPAMTGIHLTMSGETDSAVATKQPAMEGGE